MIDDAALYLEKAEESLAGAESEFVNGRFNNVANRAYYACFLAAISALIRARMVPRGPRDQWGHEFVHGQFVGELINRGKRYPAELRDVLARNLELRQAGDYKAQRVSQTQASRAIIRARRFVEVIGGRG